MKLLILIAVILSVLGCSGGSNSASAPTTQAERKEAAAGREKVLDANVNPDQKAEIQRMQATSGQ